MSRNFDGKVLVTGGSGFIGSAVLAELALSGASCRLLIPPNVRLSADLDQHDRITGDIRDRECLKRAMHGVNYLFHIAGDYRLWANDPREIYSVNIDGTRAVMEEALAANLACIIHTSSASTIKQMQKAPADETSLACVMDADSPYMKSKIIADQIIRELIRTHNLPAITVKPTTVIGPGDLRPTPTGQLVLNAVRGKVPAYVATNLNICSVNDVAKGYVLAFRNGVIGRDYILGGDNVTLQEFLLEVSRQIDGRAPWFQLPAAPLLPLAYANEFRCRLTGATPFLTVAGIKHARRGLVYNTERARKELGYTSRPFAETIKNAVSFFQAYTGTFHASTPQD
jgi:dihydroflavonol-4-reductase